MLHLLNSIFGEEFKKRETSTIGNSAYIKLDRERRIEVSFYNTFSIDSYDAVKLKLISKREGDLNCRIVKFEDVFSNIQDLTHPNKIGKHIWKNRGDYSWYGKPTKEDICRLKNTLKEYVALWE